MYCNVCGQDGPDDSQICSYCGSVYTSHSLIVDDDEEIEREESEPDFSKDTSFSFRSFMRIICTVFGVLFLVMLCFSGFRNIIVRNFIPPATLMKKTYCNSVEQIISKAHTTDSLSIGENMAASYQLNVKNSDSLLSFLSNSVQAKPEELRGLSDIRITCDAAYTDGVLNAKYDLGLKQNNILSLEQYWDRNRMEQLIRIPELTDDYLLVDMTENPLSYDAVNSDYHIAAQIDSDMLNVVCQFYVEMLIDGFENINKSKQTVIYNGISQRMTVLRATISTENLYQVLITILDDASHNPDVTEMIQSIELQTGLMYYDDFLTSLSQERTKLEQIFRQSDLNGEFTLYTYLNHNNAITGLRLAYTQDGKLYPIVSCITVSDGKQFATDVSLSNRYQMQGIGTIDRVLNGTFSVFDSQEQICDIVFTDFMCNSSALSGSIRLIPSEEIVEHILDEAGLYDVYLNADRLQDFSLDLTVDWNDESKMLSGAICSGKELLSSVYISIEMIDIPIIDMKTEEYHVLDKKHWLKSINDEVWENMLDRLESAGIKREVFSDHLGKTES